MVSLPPAIRAMAFDAALHLLQARQVWFAPAGVRIRQWPARLASQGPGRPGCRLAGGLLRLGGGGSRGRTRSSWLLDLAPRRPGRRRRCPPEARPQLLGHHLHLHGRAGAAILGGPCPLLQSAHDHDPAALGQRLRGMLGLSRHTITVKNDASCSRRPDTATRNMALATPPSVCRSSGVVGGVAGEAHGCLGHGASLPECLAGRSALPLEPGKGAHRGMPQGHPGQAAEPTKSAMHEGRRPGRRVARPRLASRAGHWRMRTPAGANQTWRSVCTVSTPEFKPNVRTIDGCLTVGPAR
jgi:hypothetical protein